MLGEILLITLVIVVILIAFASAQISKDTEEKAKQTKTLQAIPNFSPSISFKGGSLGAGLAIDIARKKLAVVPQVGLPRVYAFRQLTDANVEKNGISIQSTNRGSQAAGAAVGGVLLGPAGMLIGGLSGTKRQMEKVTRLSLKIYTNDLVRPTEEVVFFQDASGADTDDLHLKEAAGNLDQWYGRLKGIIATPQQLQAFVENTNSYNVYIVSDGGRKIQLIKAIREFNGMGLTEAKALSESLPTAIAMSLSLDEAEALASSFRSTGAEVSVEPEVA